MTIEHFLGCAKSAMISESLYFYNISLVPRPFLLPAFDHLQYAKMEGEGLGDGVTCMTSGRHVYFTVTLHSSFSDVPHLHDGFPDTI